MSAPLSASAMWRLARATVCIVPLAAGGCADPRTGRVDVARSLLLGAGVGAAAFGVGALIEDGTRGRRYGGHGRPYLPPVAGPPHGYGAPYGHGYGW